MTTHRTEGPPSTPGTGTPVRSTPLTERALAPDLARGMMLLLIALAHVPWFLYDAPAGLAMLHPDQGNLADRIAQVASLVVVDARTHTMFGFLFAYGIGQMYTRQKAHGTRDADARRILRTRHLWMLALGAVHALLLWQGDIIGTYGLIGLLMVPLFLHRTDRTLKVWTAVLLAAGALFTALSVLGAMAAPAGAPGVDAAAVQRASIAETGYLLSAAVRLPTWLFGLGSGLASLALPTVFLIGLLAARHRFLEEPQRHLPLLRRVAVWGIAAGWVPGLVLGLQHVGVLDPVYGPAVASVHFYTGIFTGVGYAALFGLLAHRLTARGGGPSLPVRGLVALGRRSLSGYLAQSVVFAPFLAAWGLGLGVHLSSWSAVLVAFGTWLLTVLAAYLLDRAGKRGPAEVLLRTLTYRGAARPARTTGAREEPPSSGS
ncbi:DUF418 domain-containing protein [Streptomonospora nanhaiensis]|uniref:DUF418 domain-containing protein n=1 Tax=Streptomonospora nanhaiensis TaxID=1323731 RepID=A0ABY6YGI2_9ACTN|nr:DUF418 domain-containing protein [Streptomonospora nanhaiensis]WAE71357.1 DUF418 domain-containing protein [Streptomonospora nanhaiensis]